MARIEWAMWANEQGVASAVSEYSTSGFGLCEDTSLFIFCCLQRQVRWLPTYSDLERFFILNDRT